MEKATLAFLRHRAFWKATIGSKDPEVREVQKTLSTEYLHQKAMIKVIDVN